MANASVRRGVRVFSAYVVAVLATYVLASVAVTQWNLASLSQMGYEVDAGTRLLTTGQDLLGLVPAYGLMVAVALAIALPVASGIARFAPTLRGFGLVSAGFVAIVCVHVILQQATDVSAVAATRTLGGLLAQGLAGGVGGYLYYLMRKT